MFESLFQFICLFESAPPNITRTVVCGYDVHHFWGTSGIYFKQYRPSEVCGSDDEFDKSRMLQVLSEVTTSLIFPHFYSSEGTTKDEELLYAHNELGIAWALEILARPSGILTIFSFFYLFRKRKQTFNQASQQTRALYRRSCFVEETLQTFVFNGSGS
jgi:hypothetical protein